MKIAAAYTDVTGIAGARHKAEGRKVFDNSGKLIGYVRREYRAGRVGSTRHRLDGFGYVGIDGVYKKAHTMEDLMRKMTPLRERLCTPMTVGEAAIAASTVL